VLRFLFYVVNKSFLFNIPFEEALKCFIYAIRFDISTVAYVLLPVGFLSLLPFNFRFKLAYQNIVYFFFILAVIIVLMLELIDIGFYEHNLKRTTLSILKISTDVQNAMSSIFLTHWYLFILGFLLLFMIIFLRKRLLKPILNIRYSFFSQLIIFILFIPLNIIMLRGGWQYLPLTPVNAKQFTDPKYANLSLNTTFCFLHSIIKTGLEDKKYYSQDEVNKTIPTTHNYATDKQFISMKDMNICILLMESFSKEFIKSYNPKQNHTPFLDSLINQYYSSENGYANGLHSNQGVASTFASIPALMDEAFMISDYQSNYFEGMPALLAKKGYTTAFFHGCHNGSFNIDAFAKSCGFNQYFGKNEYNNNADYDGVWGIYDYPFLQFTAKKINTLKQPFCVGIFSISSHHPFNYEKWFTKRLSNPNQHPFLSTIEYSDYSFKQFFETAKKESWYKNTIYVLVADHTTPEQCTPAYQTWVKKYGIPVIMFTGNDSLNKKWFNKKSNEIFQQIDISPTLLHLVGYNKPFFSFGNSIFDTINKNHFTINYVDNVYKIIDTSYTLHFENDKTIGFYNFKKDPELLHNLKNENLPIQIELEKKIKSFIQQHNFRLKNNKMQAD
jgi:phosphoglycerol transferase MdoB-like AlkP superfamily enzyme